MVIPGANHERSGPLLIALFTLSSFAAAQQASPGRLRGTVRDAELQLPLGNARVAIVELGRSTVTDEAGNYSLDRVSAGTYTVVISKSGYVRAVRAGVVINSAAMTEIDVALPPVVVEVPEFVVEDLLDLDAGSEVALLDLRFESPSVMDSIGADMMGRAGVSDAASALRIVAGATVRDGKSAVIRGLPDRYVSSQVNAMRLPSADEDKRAVELDQFPGAVVESIQVSKTFTPDQQGDASGGAVDVRLVGVPSVPFFFDLKLQTTYDSQATGRSRFLTYEGGGVHAWGRGVEDRAPQLESLGENWTGAVGVQRAEAPEEYKLSTSLGGSLDVGDYVVGGFASFVYERDSAFDDSGIDDSMWVERPGAPMTPKAFQGSVGEGDFKTGLFDVTRGSQSVQWGGVAGVGIATESQSIDLTYFYTRTAEDAAVLAEDTRGKQFFFPGHDPNDPNTPGHSEPDAAPYLRLETLQYTERIAETLQLRGSHEMALDLGVFDSPTLRWSVADSAATARQPDKRQFGSQFRPARSFGPLTIPATQLPFKPSANFTLGNLQRIYKTIEEESQQYSGDLDLPFGDWADGEGALRFGVYRDKVRRTFDQDTFSNFGDNSSFNAPFEQLWSAAFPFESHPITASESDVDYVGDQRIDAWYAMTELPVLDDLTIVGGVRFESTEIGIVNDAESEATWFPAGSLAQTQLNPGDADVDFRQADALPAITLIYRPLDRLTLRAAYSETVARPTFKELTPILQQEFLGGPIFIGNPELGMSALQNFDLRIDFEPYAGGLWSASWFRKNIDKPIEYVQKIASFDYTTAENYPRGVLKGVELEARQALGHYWEGLEGTSIGANATFIDATVTLPADEAAAFNLPNIQAPMTERDMTNAPEHLYNLFLTLDLERTGTRLGLFYTVQGDTLVAGAGQSTGNFVPSVYATGFDTLNFTLAQQLSPYLSLQFRAKNLTNPTIREVYRSPYIGGDVTNTARRAGTEFSISIGGEVSF